MLEVMTNESDSAEPNGIGVEPGVGTSAELAAFESEMMSGLRRVFGSGKWLAVSEAAMSATGLASRLASVGDGPVDDRILAVSAFSQGAGSSSSVDPATGVEHISLELPPAADLVAGIRIAQRAYGDLPGDVQARIDSWDPQSTARAVMPFTSSAPAVGGRATFGVTREAWKLLEDKLVATDVWHKAGVPYAPFELVDLADEHTGLAAHHRLANDYGSVWALDNSNGWHGGGDGTFWIRNSGEVLAFMTAHRQTNRQARVMPFLAGVPCSIHGMVVADRTISFMPCETIMFLDQEAGKFHYGRSGTFWRAPDAVVSAMRAAVEAVGDELNRRVGFRGVFTLDGVADARSFMPTEINPRFGAALPMAHPTSAGETLSLFLLHLCVVEEAMPDLDPQLLEQWVRSQMENSPESRVMTKVSRSPTGSDLSPQARVWVPSGTHRSVDPADVLLIDVDDPATPDDMDTHMVASVEWGERGDYGLIRLHFEPDAVEPGEPLAPLALSSGG